ncbi:MAG: PEP-CTERM sorting domain-containing protein [Planctomycetota bacterium]
MKRTKLASIVALTVVMGIVSVASAEPIGPSFAVQDIIDGTGAITVQDKVFSDFSVVSPNAENEDSVAPSADELFVQGWVWESGPYAGEVGLRFDGGWMAGYEKTAASTIKFRVQADDPYLISDNTLYTTAFDAILGGSAGVTESVYHDEPVAGVERFEGKSIYTYSDTGAEKQTDHVDYDPADYDDDIWVSVGVTVTGGNDDEDAHAQLNDFYITFSQVPEPATMAVLGLGGLTMLLRRKRQ